MTVENAERLIAKLDQDTTTQNFIAQSSARHILFSVGELVENFPKFRTNLDQGANNIAFSYISLGCFLAEEGSYSKSIDPLQKGAELLEYCHKHEANRDQYSSYYVLISALAYYAASQYSKSFILLKDTEAKTIIAQIISLFLKKEFVKLIRITNSIVLNSQFIGEEENVLEPNGKVYQLLLARSIGSLLEYIYSGNEYYLENAKDTIDDLLELARIDGEPSIWWVMRLLKIIIDRFGKYSLWSTIPPILTKETSEGEEVRKFILGLTFRKIPVVELFLTQEQALQKVSNENGAVICLPTSSGKTRIAEIAILKCLTEYPESVILFLAPFRSLAHELEESLNSTFEPLNYKITHLYGGNQFGRIDRLLIEDSSIIIATPEKAKAIIRADSDIKGKIKLVVIDEGHLLDDNQRNVINELFIEELKYHVSKNNGKMLLLSAVLPNSEEIAQWVANDSENFVRSDWRPATQKFGIMYFTGNNVDIAWKEEEKTYNKNFIKPFRPTGKRKDFPKDKNQAIAATAVKLSRLGTVLIFVGITKSIKGYAKEVLTALAENQESHQWANTKDWRSFQLICRESLGEQSHILKYAEHGIVCHGRKLLPQDVRLAIEKLMRNGNPKIVISTSTLAQGVNLGVSNVIIASAWINGRPMDSKTFMNIAGRAGRAFTDSEGRILYAIDSTKEKWRLDREVGMAKGYFDSANVEPAYSGLLLILNKIWQVAQNCNINFEALLEIIAENNFSEFKDTNGTSYDEEIKDYLDWIDDTLLSLSIEYTDFSADSSSDWIDDHFRTSLACIQAEHQELSSDDIILFLKARNTGVKNISGDSISNWKSHVSSGLPLRSAIYIDSILESILKFTHEYLSSDRLTGDQIGLLSSIEALLTKLPSSHFRNIYSIDELDRVRKLWLSATPINEILELDKGLEICNNYYGYTIPWILNSISKKLKKIGYENEGEVFEELSVLCELGVPNFLASKIYLAGIKSRSAATELSNISDLNFFLADQSPSQIASFIAQNVSFLKEEVSEASANWVEALANQTIIKRNKITSPKIKLRSKIDSDILIIRKLEDSIYLCSPNFDEKVKIDNERLKLSLSEIADNLALYFEQSQPEGLWVLKSRDPNTIVEL